MQKIASELKKWAQTKEDKEAMPHVRKGYQNTMNELNKLASDTFERGYNDTIRILQAM